MPSNDVLQHADALSPHLRVALGLQPGVSVVHKFGRNPDIDTASGFEAIWNGGGDYTGFNATVAETVEIFSSSAADAAAGTGAQTFYIEGLDVDLVHQSEIVTLNGTTPVNTVHQYLRSARARVETAGASGGNEGAITARQSVTTANVFSVMPIGYNSTMIAAITIPAGKVGYVDDWFVTLSGKTSATCDCRFLVRPQGGVFSVKEELSISGSGTSYIQREYHTPKNGLEAGTDVYIDADSDANNTGVAAGFDITLVDM